MLATWRSKTLLTVERMDIGRYPVTEFFKASLLGTGTTRASFQSVGNMPVVRNKLHNFARLGAMEVTVIFSILSAISSGPEDLEVSSLASDSVTKSMEQRSSEGKEAGSGLSNKWMTGIVEAHRTGHWRLKQPKRKLFRRTALP